MRAICLILLLYVHDKEYSRRVNKQHIAQKKLKEPAAVQQGQAGRPSGTASVRSLEVSGLNYKKKLKLSQKTQAYNKGCWKARLEG